jgi:hypothetical protein
MILPFVWRDYSYVRREVALASSLQNGRFVSKTVLPDYIIPEFPFVLLSFKIVHLTMLCVRILSCSVDGMHSGPLKIRDLTIPRKFIGEVISRKIRNFQLLNFLLIA